MNRVTRNGLIGWAAVGVVVSLYDTAAIRNQGDTMSAYCRRHPHLAYPVAAILLAHLFGPRSLAPLDPISHLGRLIPRKV